ncbi:MAG: recombinase family protein [Staphylococcus epidermidis]|nr:recombinase family protein [Staphylococcus epidermidis]MDH8788461.1 recombinase family protein [Staphylococcus epidermidis]MDH8853837.1 recombinase family protein [Staphylococcus epidermidis]MDH8881839.1 recombinase family protein [Staphylococcus epidermidis]MDH8884141.1 recombinase family protein [Staphylococcus epidermidis]
MKVGYARVSTKNQDVNRQIEELTKYGCKKIFNEQVSGKNRQDRQEFNKALAFLREGDELVVESLERLGRNYNDVKEIVQHLKDMKVKLTITSLPMLSESFNNPLLDNFVKDLIIQILAMIGQQEREEMIRKTKQGIAKAKAKGRMKGRPQLYSPNSKNKQRRVIYQNVVNLLEQGEPISHIAKINGISRPTVYKIKNQNNYEGGV